MVPPPGVVGAHVRIQGIVAVLHQEFCGLQAFLNVTALLLKLLAGKGALSPVLDHALDAEPQGHREIVSAAGLDFLHHFLRETQPVLQGAAVLVVS